jgi:preprotein translocase subunit SecG
MMWIIGILTFFLVIDCLFLILLVLVQLPKKEAGLGQAFGGGATDALFGAGSGNALTKLTKYATGIFFVLTLSLSILHAQQSKNRHSGLERAMQKASEAEPAAPAAATKSTPVPVTAPAPLMTTTNVPAATPSTAAPGTTTPAPQQPAPANPNPAPPEKK